jgi:hypothetical protein
LVVFDEWSSLVIHVAMDNTVIEHDISNDIVLFFFYRLCFNTGNHMDRLCFNMKMKTDLDEISLPIKFVHRYFVIVEIMNV